MKNIKNVPLEILVDKNNKQVKDGDPAAVRTVVVQPGETITAILLPEKKAFLLKGGFIGEHAPDAGHAEQPQKSGPSGT